MKAVTVQPGVANSFHFEEVPEPDESTGSILVDMAKEVVPQREKNGYRVWFDPGEAQRFPNLYGWFMRFVLKFVIKKEVTP